MMEHSPDAWEHVLFKDVCGKVSNSEVHYRALQFYLDEHPDLLNNLLETLTPRLDHARVVDLMRKAEHLPLVKPYLVAVQPSNLAAVNEALNGLLIEEEDFEGLRASIDAYDAFDQVGLAQVCESHELIEFRRVASHLYKRNLRWRQSVEMSKRDKLYKDAMETAAQSKDDALAGELLEFFVQGGHKECFAGCLYHCYDLIRPDKALEMAWMNGMTDFAMPYLIQSLRDYASKVDSLVSERDDARAEAKKAQNSSANDAAQSNMYAQMMPPALPAPTMPGQSSPGMMPPGGYGAQTF
jgi:clathrin heavy chain